MSEFKEHVQPLFDLAEIQYHLIVTGRTGILFILLAIEWGVRNPGKTLHYGYNITIVSSIMYMILSH